MKIVDATIEDGKMCAQLINFLKVGSPPAGTTYVDCQAITATLTWFNEFVKALATDLSSKSKKEPLPPVKPAMILPVPKKKKGKK